MARIRIMVVCTFVLAGALPLRAQEAEYLYGFPPGKADARVDGETITLKNDVLSAEWRVSGGKLLGGSFHGVSETSAIALLKYPFVLRMADGKTVSSASMRVVGRPEVQQLAVDA